MRDLTPDTTLGYECIEFAENVLGLDLMPWQKWFVLHALELHPTDVGTDGGPLFRFRKVMLLVGRQNGKSTVMQALTLWRMFVDRCNLVIGTAQDLEISETLLKESYEMAQEIDELAAELKPLVRGSGKMSYSLRTGETYKVKSASRRGGRGLSGELVLLDELREHQNWDAWGAVTKTTNAKERAQIYGISNAGDASSIVLRHLRLAAHARLGDPDGLNAALEVGGPDLADTLPDDIDPEGMDDDSVGWFEWSAAPGRSKWDRDGWYQANPALGWRMREQTLASDCATDPEWVFRTECLCQWSDGSLEGPFPPGAWDQGVDPGSRVSPDYPVVLGIDVSWDRGMTDIALCGRRTDGQLHGETIASRAGTDWVLDWFTSPERQQRVRDAAVVCQSTGAPVSSLVESLQEAKVRVIDWKGPDLGKATGAFYDLVRDHKLYHPPSAALDLAAATGVPKMLDSGAFVFDRKKSPHNVSPLIALVAACWWAVKRDEHPEPAVHEWPDEAEMTTWEDT